MLRGMYGGYMEPIFPFLFKKYTSKAKNGVIHQETCPECGKTLCNLYYRNDTWRCKKCCDKAVQSTPTKNGTVTKLETRQGDNGPYGNCPYCGEHNSSCTSIEDEFEVTYNIQDYEIFNKTEKYLGTKYHYPNCVACGRDLTPIVED